MPARIASPFRTAPAGDRLPSRGARHVALRETLTSHGRTTPSLGRRGRSAEKTFLLLRLWAWCAFSYPDKAGLETFRCQSSLNTASSHVGHVATTSISGWPLRADHCLAKVLPVDGHVFKAACA